DPASTRLTPANPEARPTSAIPDLTPTFQRSWPSPEPEETSPVSTPDRDAELQRSSPRDAPEPAMRPGSTSILSGIHRAMDQQVPGTNGLRETRSDFPRFGDRGPRSFVGEVQL